MRTSIKEGWKAANANKVKGKIPSPQ